MKLLPFFVVFITLALPAGASTVHSWTQLDITGHNLTVNYTSSFNVSRNDTLEITIRNIGDVSLNDTITINEINVSDASASMANGRWTGSVQVPPGSSETINLELNMTTDAAATVDIQIYFNVSSDFQNLSVTAAYPGMANRPKITSWNNTKTNNTSTTLRVNISEVVTFSAVADQIMETWNWYRDGVNQNRNHDTLSASWDTSGTKTLQVNASNENGTSNTVEWTIAVQAPGAPRILSWSNTKTNDNRVAFIITPGETVRFNVTPDQAVTTWWWTLNMNNLTNTSNTLNYTFDNYGVYRIGVNGTNDNGTTQTVVWNVIVQEKEKEKVTILSWYPQVVDYVYVNDTVDETVTYEITTVDTMTETRWSVDGVAVDGSVDENVASYTHTWDNQTIGFHRIVFRGENSNSQVEFRWYVNVYEIGKYRGGNIFDTIDDALENHITDIKIRMFKYKIAKHEGKAEIAAEKVNQLHDEIAKRTMTRESLRLEFKAGNITHEEYAAAVKQAQKDAKFNQKFAKKLAKIAKQELKDEKLSKEFEAISELDDIEDTGDKEKKGKEKDKENGKKGKDKKNKNKGKD